MIKNGVLSVLVFLFSTHLVHAIEFRIVPDSKFELEERIRRLEFAVNELQNRVFNLQMNQQMIQTAPAPANLKKFQCEIEKFGKTYSEFGPTRVEASEKVRAACMRGNNGSDFFCKKEDIKCQANE